MKTRLSVSLVALCLFLSHASAATIMVPGDAGDGQVDVNGVPVDISLTEVRPGMGGGSPTTVVRGQASIFFFQLPTLSPSTIASADVQLSFLGYEGSPEFNLDVFGLGEIKGTQTPFVNQILRRQRSSLRGFSRSCVYPETYDLNRKSIENDYAQHFAFQAR